MHGSNFNNIGKRQDPEALNWAAPALLEDPNFMVIVAAQVAAAAVTTADDDVAAANMT